MKVDLVIDSSQMREGSFTGDPKDMFSKSQEWASVSIGTPLLGNMVRRSFLRTFGINRYIKRRVKMPCKRVSLSIGAPLGNMEGIRLPGLFARKG